MFDLEEARGIVGREFGGMAARAAKLTASEWAQRSRCPEWTVTDLCAHTALAAAQQAEAFRRAVAGDIRPPEYPGAPAWSTTKIVEALTAGVTDIDTAMSGMTPAALEGMVPLPFGVVPAVIAIQIPVYEYAFHGNDLAAALGEDEPLASDVAAAFLEFAFGLAPMLAGGVWAEVSGRLPPEGLSYRIAGGSGAIDLHNSGDGWQVGPAPAELPQCVVSGDDSAAALFFMGRIPHSDPRLKISGTASDAAAEFKVWFPGP